MDKILFDKNPNPMVLFNLDSFQILKFNRAFSEKYKYTPEDIEGGLSLKEIGPEEDIPELMGALEKSASTGIFQARKLRQRSKDGNIFYVRLTAQKVSHHIKNVILLIIQDISEQVAAEQQVAKMAENLQNYKANCPLASIKLDSNSKVTEWSPQAKELFDLSEEEVLNKNFISLNGFDKTERTHLKDKLAYVAKSERARDQFEAKVTHANGEPKYLKFNLSVAPGPNNEKSIHLFIEDATPKKYWEIKYRHLFDSASDGIFILKNGHFMNCNKKAEALLKTKRIIGKTMGNFSPKEQAGGMNSQKKMANYMQKARNGKEQQFEWRFKDRENNLVDVEIKLHKVELPDGEYVQALVRDITHKKKMMADLRKKREWFKVLFIKLPAALAMIDKDNKVLLVNESFEDMFGYSLNEIKGHDIDALMIPAENGKEAKNIKEQVQNGTKIHFEGQRLTKTGEKKEVMGARIPVSLNDEPIAGLHMYIDISERVKSEDKVKNSLEEKQFMLKEIHHRLKNDLAVISGFLQLQSIELEDESVKEVLHETQLRIKSIALVHELLYQSKDLSSISLGQYLNRLVENISDIIPFKSDHINVDVQTEEVHISDNKAIPCAILINELLTNIYKHAFEGRQQGNIRVEVSKNGGKVQVEVTDDGVGLPDDFSLDSSSSLGMNLISALAKQLKADLTYNSSSAGTTFRFGFDITEPEKAKMALA